jgi:hypothetical protein
MAKLGISTGTIPNDGSGDSLLDGAVKINDNFDEIYAYFGDGTNLTFTSESSSQWVTTSAGIHTLSNVGIGTTNPTENLTVFGDARVTGILTIGTASITLDGSSNTITVGSGVTIDGFTGIIEATSLVVGGTTLTGAAVTSITAGTGISVDQSTGNVTISATGGGGGEESYWVETSAGIHTLSNVGIGTTNPESKLTIIGDAFISGVVTATSFIGNASSATYADSAGISTNVFGGAASITSLSVSGISTLGTIQVSSGIITATSGIVTYYGDTSYTTDGRWTLGANGSSDYTFIGIGFTQTTNDPVLYLARGRVYEFVNNSGGSHPFEIRVSDGGSAYNDGVTNNGAASGVIRFEIPFNAPNTLYYQCTVHSGMGNTISVYPSTI